jgi:hypothetical protein
MLSDTACKNAKAKEKLYKLADSKGLFLLVNPNGSKYFRLKYRFGGKEKTLSLGVYPETTLKQARGKQDEARSQLANIIDPGEDKRIVKLIKKTGATENCFQAVALEWFDKKMTGKSESHRERAMRLLN